LDIVGVGVGAVAVAGDARSCRDGSSRGEDRCCRSRSRCCYYYSLEVQHRVDEVLYQTCNSNDQIGRDDDDEVGEVTQGLTTVSSVYVETKVHATQYGIDNGEVLAERRCFVFEVGLDIVGHSKF
jgi:hypothetical protein